MTAACCTSSLCVNIMVDCRLPFCLLKQLQRLKKRFENTAADLHCHFWTSENNNYRTPSVCVCVCVCVWSYWSSVTLLNIFVGQIIDQLQPAGDITLRVIRSGSARKDRRRRCSSWDENKTSREQRGLEWKTSFAMGNLKIFLIRNTYWIKSKCICARSRKTQVNSRRWDLLNNMPLQCDRKVTMWSNITEGRSDASKYHHCHQWHHHKYLMENFLIM